MLYAEGGIVRFVMGYGAVRERIVTIMGPTASGKTSLGISLAKELGGEIISGDAFQVYRHLDIGTAKVKVEEMDGIRHHLIDIKEVTDTYTAAEFCQYARTLITEITSRGNVPIIVGGTGLYIQALLEGYDFPTCGISTAATLYWENIYESEGLKGLIAAMEKLSPTYFDSRPVADKQRLIRALSILSTGGDYRAGKAANVPIYAGPAYALWPERAHMYARINKRVDQMIEDGLEEEAGWLYRQTAGKQTQAAKGIGYKEWWPFFERRVAYPHVVAAIQRNTRRFAKRQQTWLRRMAYIQPLPVTDEMRPMFSVKELVTDVKKKWSESYDEQ